MVVKGTILTMAVFFTLDEINNIQKKEDNIVSRIIPAILWGIFYIAIS